MPGENETFGIVQVNPQIRKSVSLYSTIRKACDRVWSMFAQVEKLNQSTLDWQ